MGQINLYKIDAKKAIEFINKLGIGYRCIGEQEYTLKDDEGNTYRISTYVDDAGQEKEVSWQWILDEYNHEPLRTVSSPKAVVVVENSGYMYALTYGMSYFAVDKFCDTDFAFDFARRISFKEIKTTTLTSPNAQRNKMINAYIDYKELEYDSGESYAKIKAKVDVDKGFKIHGKTIEIGHSIKTQLLENDMYSILRFIEYVEKTRLKEEKQKIPIFCKIKDTEVIKELDADLLERIEEDVDCINISEFDIIGATEVFNNNDTTYTLIHTSGEKKDIEELSKETIIEYVETNGLELRKDFLDIRVVCSKNGSRVCTEPIKKLIDFVNDERKSLLLKGDWYYFNEDYVQYLQDSISQIPTVYEKEYDFTTERYDAYLDKKYHEEKHEYGGLTDEEIRKNIKNKYYAERAFNNILAEEYGFQNFDRQNAFIEGNRTEPMDLYKDGVALAVKIANTSSKLNYAVDQSLGTLKIYKHKLLPELPQIDSLGVWIILRKHKELPIEDGQPDLTKLQMISLKNRLDAWKKEVRLQGYKPVIYLNYWD